MSTTQTIQPQGDNKSKGNAGKYVATGVAAAAAGVGGTVAASNLMADDEPVEVKEEAVNEPQQDQPSTEPQAAEPQPAVETPVEEPVVAHHTEPEPVVTPVTPQPSHIDEPEPYVPGPQPQPQPEPAPYEPEPAPAPVQPVNPDEIAEAIIAEEQIDPNDIDVADVVNFDSIGTVYTVEGESVIAARFHDEDGNEMMMVDVDGDDYFDLIADLDGTPIMNMPENLVSVSDAELSIAGEGNYIAANDDHIDEFGADSLNQDLIS